MSKNIISGLVVVAVLIVGGFLVQKNSKKAEAPVPPIDRSDTATPEPTSGKKMAFSQLIKQEGDYKCEVKQYLSDIENTGTVYLNGKNIRGEFSTIAEGRKIDSTFIMKDGYSYSWTSMLPSMGFKVKVNTDTNTGETTAPSSGNYSFDGSQIGDYNCEAWSVDPLMFTIPTNITFKDIVTK